MATLPKHMDALYDYQSASNRWSNRKATVLEDEELNRIIKGKKAFDCMLEDNDDEVFLLISSIPFQTINYTNSRFNGCKQSRHTKCS